MQGGLWCCSACIGEVCKNNGVPQECLPNPCKYCFLGEWFHKSTNDEANVPDGWLVCPFHLLGMQARVITDLFFKVSGGMNDKAWNRQMHWSDTSSLHPTSNPIVGEPYRFNTSETLTLCMEIKRNTKVRHCKRII